MGLWLERACTGWKLGDAAARVENLQLPARRKLSLFVALDSMEIYSRTWRFAGRSSRQV